MAETTYYDSPMTGAELDEAFAGLAGMEQTAAQVAQNAETARQYGQIVEDNAQGIAQISENLAEILSAAECAQTAAKSAGEAETSALQAAESAQQAQQIAQGAMGWYETETSLKTVHPAGQNGQWAIIGSTDTIWTWDSDTNSWKNTSVKTDLSGYYTKEQSDARYVLRSGFSEFCPYDVGDILTTSKAGNPAQRWPGTSWQQIEDVFLLAAGDTYKEGNTGGEASHTLSQAELPSYDLTVNGGNNLIFSRTGADPAVYTQEAGSGWGLPNWGVDNVQVSSGGFNQAHNNMPPYLAVYMWKRTA